MLSKRIKKTVYTVLCKTPSLFSVAKHSLLAYRKLRYWFTSLFIKVDPYTVVFESYMGRSYSCSPRAIFREMKGDPRFRGYTFIWILRPSAREQLLESELNELGGTVIVDYLGSKYHSSYAKASIWITNSILPKHLVPCQGQYLLQTWHGTPLKKLGCDIPENFENIERSSREIVSRYIHEASRINALVSPSQFCSEKFATAFSLEKQGCLHKLIETGAPRNDVLINTSEATSLLARTRLGIDADKKAILYAPTFRDNQHAAGEGFEYSLAVDFKRWHKHLGDEYVILFRAHYLISSQFDFSAHGGFVRDVSKVNDINDLYLASDVLITDYSSVFFDYSLLNKPMLFYLYDLEVYANNLRGFYLSLDELPGPIVENETDLLDMVLETNLENITHSSDSFRVKFLPLDDGRASKRVVDYLYSSVGNSLSQC